MVNDSLAWMAGFFDGEGSLAIQVMLPDKRRRTPILVPRMQIKLKYGCEVLEEFQKAFGGQLYQHRQKAREGWSWNLMGRENLRRAVEQLLPYLRVKRRIAERFLAVLALFPSDQAIRAVNRYRGERAWTDEATVVVMDVAITLNPPDTKNAKQKKHAARIRRYIRELKKAA